MTARDIQIDDAGTDLEAALPVLLNTYKHHAGALRQRIARIAAGGEPALAVMSERLAVLGTRLMDLYTGAMSPRAVSLWVRDELQRAGRLDPAVFRAWLASCGEYATITHPEDGTAWVLRIGDEDARFVHLHPGRHSPNTVRVRANVIKTAFVAHAVARVRGGDPMDRHLLDAVRKEFLGLPPVGRDPEGGEGVGAVIALLRPTG